MLGGDILTHDQIIVGKYGLKVSNLFAGIEGHSPVFRLRAGYNAPVYIEDVDFVDFHGPGDPAVIRHLELLVGNRQGVGNGLGPNLVFFIQRIGKGLNVFLIFHNHLLNIGDRGGGGGVGIAAVVFILQKAFQRQQEHKQNDDRSEGH